MSDEELAREILAEHDGSKLFEPFVAALRSVREEERKLAAAEARAWCYRCIPGEDAGPDIEEAILAGSERAGDRDSPD